MVNPVFMASLVTIVPAMGALFWFLRRYEGYFEDARVFFALIFGFFAGLVAAAFELATNFGSPSFGQAIGWVPAFLLFVVGYAFFETGMKTMVMGLGRFKGRRDTPYYGMAFGLGFGAMIALMLIANAIRLSIENGTEYTPLTFAAMVLLPVGAIFAHGATGAFVGLGSADNKLWRGWGIGTLLQMPILMCLRMWWPDIGNGDSTAFFPLIVGALYGSALLLITQTRVLDKVVPPEIQRQIALDKRRAARGHGEEE